MGKNFEIELPPSRIEFMGRALLPVPDHQVVVDAFDFTSVYMAFDHMGISFVAKGDPNRGEPERQRRLMALPDFIAMILREEGRVEESLTEDEKTKLKILGFRPDNIEAAERDAVHFNGLLNKNE